MKYYKRETKGFVADEILNWEFPESKPKSTKALPPGLQKHVDELLASSNKGATTWGQRFKDFDNQNAKRAAGFKISRARL
jgi:hypothetical protein